MIVAVDGPGGAGKSSVCKAVAERLRFVLVDTGALYRAVGHTALSRGLPLEDADRMGELARSLDVRFKRDADGAQRVYCGGDDITRAIRTAAVGKAASVVSAHPTVRQALLEQQRLLGRAQDSIVEGRDIGTVVFPDAELKVFYTASVDARTERRFSELRSRGREASLETVRAALVERDARDSNRAVAPLRQPEDAVVLDTSEMSFEEATEALIALIEGVREQA